MSDLTHVTAVPPGSAAQFSPEPFPRTHRLPGALRALIYLLAAAAVSWLAIIGFFAYELSRPGVHLG